MEILIGIGIFTEYAKNNPSKSNYLNLKRYYDLPESKTDPKLIEYVFMHGVLGVLVWNAVRPR
jgi:hypothetical protein